MGPVVHSSRRRRITHLCQCCQCYITDHGKHSLRNWWMGNTFFNKYVWYGGMGTHYSLRTRRARRVPFEGLLKESLRNPRGILRSWRNPGALDPANKYLKNSKPRNQQVKALSIRSNLTGGAEGFLVRSSSAAPTNVCATASTTSTAVMAIPKRMDQYKYQYQTHTCIASSLENGTHF